MRMRSIRLGTLVLLIALTATACSSAASPQLVDPPEETTVPATSTVDEPAETQPEPAIDPNQEFPDVIDVEAERVGSGPMDFDVTISSPYDTPERYADAWRVVDGVTDEVLGIRELTHDHQNEQPFTRSLRGVEVPESVTEIRIEARDSVNGWGGQSITLDISR